MNFQQRRAGCGIDAANNGGVSTRSQSLHNGGFTTVAGSKAACLNFRLLVSHPIVVRGNQIITGIEKANGRILQDINYAELSQSRTQCAYNYLFGRAATNDETGNAEMLARFDPEPG